MASGRSSSNSMYSTPQMARRTTTSDNRSPSGSSGRHTSTSTRAHSYSRSDSNNPETMTLELVEDFKRSIPRKGRDQKQMTQSDVESKVAELRSTINADQCNIDRWKENLPQDIQSCPKRILHLSMAYGNDPREVQSIIQTKMNDTDTDENPTDTSLDNITGPLTKLKKELDKNKSASLFRDVRNFDERHIDRANRLFLSEAYHMARGLKGYTYADAENAVKAIRETDCERDDSSTILSIVKTLPDADDIRDYLNKLSQEEKDRKQSVSSDDDRTPPPSPKKNSSSSKPNDTSSFHIKPLNNPYSSKPPMSSSRRFEHRDDDDDDEPSRSPPRHRPSRN